MLERLRHGAGFVAQLLNHLCHPGRRIRGQLSAASVHKARNRGFETPAALATSLMVMRWRVVAGAPAFEEEWGIYGVVKGTSQHMWCLESVNVASALHVLHVIVG